MPLGSPGQKLFRVRIVKSDGFVQVPGFQSHERAGNVIEDLNEETARALVDGGYGVLVQGRTAHGKRRSESRDSRGSHSAKSRMTPRLPSIRLLSKASPGGWQVRRGSQR